MWISLLAVPTLMTFTLDNEGHITYLNVIGLVYSICTAFLWERMMPGYMVRYIKKLILVACYQPGSVRAKRM